MRSEAFGGRSMSPVWISWFGGSASEKGREETTASCARRTLAAATSFMASVIFCVFLTESMRVRSSRREHRTTRPERGAELPRRWVVEALLASDEEDQAVERW